MTALFDMHIIHECMNREAICITFWRNISRMFLLWWIRKVAPSCRSSCLTGIHVMARVSRFTSRWLDGMSAPSRTGKFTIIHCHTIVCATIKGILRYALGSSFLAFNFPSTRSSHSGSSLLLTVGEVLFSWEWQLTIRSALRTATRPITHQPWDVHF